MLSLQKAVVSNTVKTGLKFWRREQLRKMRLCEMGIIHTANQGLNQVLNVEKMHNMS